MRAFFFRRFVDWFGLIRKIIGLLCFFKGQVLGVFMRLRPFIGHFMHVLWASSKNLHICSFFLLRLLFGGPRYRLTEDEETQGCGTETEVAVVRLRNKILDARWQGRPRLGVAEYFVSLLFEMYGIEGICGRFERIGV